MNRENVCVKIFSNNDFDVVVSDSSLAHTRMKAPEPDPLPNASRDDANFFRSFTRQICFSSVTSIQVD